MTAESPRTLTRRDIRPGDTAKFEFRNWDDSTFWVEGDLYRHGWDGSWHIGPEAVRNPHGRWDEDAHFVSARTGKPLPDFPDRTRFTDASQLRAGDIAVFWVLDPLVPSAYHRNQTFWGEVILDGAGDRSLGRHKLFTDSKPVFSSRSFQYALRE